MRDAETDPSTSSQKDDAATLCRIYGLYLIATIAMTWPVAVRIGRELPGAPGDPQMYLWNIWWLKHSLFELHQNPFWCSYVNWPFGVSFAYHTHTIVFSIIAILLEPLGINYGASLSLIFLNSFALTGLGTYLWCREFRVSRAAAFVGGFVVAFSIYRLGRGLAHYNLLTTELLPFICLALKRGVENARVKSFLVAALLIVVVFWQEFQMFIFVSFFSAFLVGALIWARPGRLGRKEFWRGTVLAAAIVLIGTLPYWLEAVPLLARGDYAVRDNSGPIRADAVSFFIPWSLHWLFGRWTQPLNESIAPVQALGSPYIGFITLALAVMGLRAARREKRGLLWFGVAAAFFAILTLGEQLQVAGHETPIPLPARILGAMPGLRQFRGFPRFIVLAMFALAVPAAVGTDWCLQRLRQRRVKRLFVPGVCVLIGLEVASLPYLTFPLIIPNYAGYSLLERIRKDPEMTTVFTVPPMIHLYQETYQQMFHHKPVYGMGHSRFPRWIEQRHYGMPGIRHLFWERQQFLKEDEAAKNLTPEFVERFIELHNIKYLLLTGSPKYSVVRRLVESHFPIKEYWYEGGFVLYELERRLGEHPLNIDLSRHWGFLYQGRGFYFPEESFGAWANQLEPEILLPIRGRSWKAITIEMTPFVKEEMEPQDVEIYLNDVYLGHARLKPRFTEFQYAIPAEALDDRPYSTLRFRFSYCVSPSELGISEDPRTLVAAFRRLHVRAEPREDLPLLTP